MKHQMKRLIGRLVYCPSRHRGQQAGFNYRDVTAKRISLNFCWIQNTDLSQVEDWGTFKESEFRRLIQRFVCWLRYL